jgi:hypothetical protein
MTGCAGRNGSMYKKLRKSCGKRCAIIFVIPSEARNPSLFFLGPDRREIPRFARNGKIDSVFAAW